MAGGMHGGGRHSKGHAWWGACVMGEHALQGVYMAGSMYGGGVCGRGHAWLGGMHNRGYA